MINYSGKKIFIFLLIFCLHYNIFSQETNNSATSTYNIVCSELKQLDLRFKILDTVRFYTECFPKNIIISFENQNSDRNLYIFATQELFCKAKNQFINYIHFLEKEKKNVNYYLVLYSDNEEQVIKNHQAGFEAYINSLDYKENSYAIILKYAEKKSKIENFTSDGSLTPLNFIKFINKAYIEHNKSFSLFTYYPLIKDKNIILDSNKNTLLFDRNITSCILPFNCSAQDFSIIKSISNNFSNYDLLQDSPKVYSNINFGKYNIWITEAWFVTFTLIIILAFCLLFIVFTTAKAAGNTNSIITKNNLINNLSAKYVYLSILEIAFYLISIVVFQNIFRSLILHPKIYLFFKLILPSLFIFIFYSFRINKNYFIELEQIGYIQILFSFLSFIYISLFNISLNFFCLIEFIIIVIANKKLSKKSNLVFALILLFFILAVIFIINFYSNYISSNFLTNCSFTKNVLIALILYPFILQLIKLIIYLKPKNTYLASIISFVIVSFIYIITANSAQFLSRKINKTRKYIEKPEQFTNISFEENDLENLVLYEIEIENKDKNNLYEIYVKGKNNSPVLECNFNYKIYDKTNVIYIPENFTGKLKLKFTTENDNGISISLNKITYDNKFIYRQRQLLKGFD